MSFVLPRGEERCAREAPALRPLGSQLLACHFADPALDAGAEPAAGATA